MKIGKTLLIVVEILVLLVSAFYLIWALRWAATPIALCVWMILLYGHAVARMLFRTVGGGERGLLTQAAALCLVLAALSILNWPMRTLLAAYIPYTLLMLENIGPPLALFLLVAAGQAQPSPEVASSEQLSGGLRKNIRLSLKMFSGLTLASLLASLVVAVWVIMFIMLRQTWGWGLEVIMVYLAASLLAQGSALREGRCAIASSDPDRLWRAGLLAMVGGLQLGVLVGVPAFVGGVLAVRNARQAIELKGQ